MNWIDICFVYIVYIIVFKDWKIFFEFCYGIYIIKGLSWYCDIGVDIFVFYVCFFVEYGGDIFIVLLFIIVKEFEVLYLYVI